MSTPTEQREAIAASVAAARRRLAELDAKPVMTRAEVFERDMTVSCIARGTKLLTGKETQRHEA